MLIRPFVEGDAPGAWRVLEPIIRAGETYALPRDMPEREALAYWTGADRRTFVVEKDGEIVGTYYLRANQAGGGAHVANCGYATSGAHRGQGIARKMAEHSLDAARAGGFRAVQFNFVVEANAPAVHLWRSLGILEVGRLPEAFHHPAAGYVDALVMFRWL
ncbi:GNAT family N-acetyltransferase [Hyphomicrobium sulfonivorans]|uniref:GNAT family N-acetyltransferase n=1 Tax=Hyphomicrobium sulfonivorans TaxID=121290 RepID=UPI00156E865C|nr:GNAT family N-acetyltransferase [Hyphomicrobium sulfonivorans]MBI1648868.1 GNAT family N-acetyltransferase [Hyphomicrobium sulfonivorans]NSL70597.1 GNAT family N-acetyltransferase [Hyphomicrobium sulfonivorans]